MSLKVTSILFILFAFLTFSPGNSHAASSLSEQASALSLVGGGKEKKNKKVSSKPSASAKKSAKGAIRAEKMKAKQIQARASVRHFFHKLFNAKPGKTRNFRKRRVRNRWKRGH